VCRGKGTQAKSVCRRRKKDTANPRTRQPVGVLRLSFHPFFSFRIHHIPLHLRI
jgi:hypothetical protein